MSGSEGSVRRNRVLNRSGITDKISSGMRVSGAPGRDAADGNGIDAAELKCHTIALADRFFQSPRWIYSSGPLMPPQRPPADKPMPMYHSPNHVHVNLPFRMVDRYLDDFLQRQLNPEIGLDAEVLDRDDQAAFKQVARQLHDRGRSVTLHGPFMDLSAGSADPAVRQLTRRRIEQVLPLIPVFKPRTVVCHAGFDWRRYGYDSGRWCEHSARLWSWFADRLHDAGSRLVLENVYESGPDELLTLMSRLVGRPVGVCLDTGHQAAFGSATLQQWIDGLGGHIEQVHLHDNHGRRDDHLALGSGSIDFDPLWVYLRHRKGPPPILTLEPHRGADLAPSLAVLNRQLGSAGEPPAAS